MRGEVYVMDFIDWAKRSVRELLQKLGVVGFAEGGGILGPSGGEDKVGPFILPPSKAVLNSMTVTIDGKDFSEYVKSVEIGYRNAPAEVVAEEQRKWEIGQEDTQPIPVYRGDDTDPDYWHNGRPIVPGTFDDPVYLDDEMDCE